MSTPPLPLYRALLGAAWNDLPAEIRAMHDVRGDMQASGTADVERGTGVVARLVARVVGLPEPGQTTPVTVRFTVRDGVETWTRIFGEREFSSAQFAGRGATAGLLCERFGPFTFAMTLVAGHGRLSLVLKRWRVLGIPLPMGWCPRADAHERVEAGRFRFYVEIRHPLAGLIVRYRGALSSPTPGW